ncbi:MAG: MCE family protein, partial [Bdellovibrio sp.]
LDETLNDETDEGFKKTWKRALVRIDSTLKNVDEVAGKINRGEGTIGRLINDESTVEELNTAIEGVSSFLDVGNKLHTGLEFNSAYLGGIGAAKTSIGIRLQPGLDRFYQIAVIDDPAGVVETTRTNTTNSLGTAESTERKTYLNRTKFSVLVAKNFYDFTLRGGLIENTGGFGFDYSFMRNRIRFSVDFFQFANLNIRPQIQYNLWKGIHLVGGYNDALNRSGAASYYLGAGLFLTNDDLKLFTSSLPLTGR